MSTKKYPLSFFIYENHENLACIGGAGGIRGNNGNNCHGKQPQNGSDASTSEGFRNVFGQPVIKAGDNADVAEIIDKDNGYNKQPYLSVVYPEANKLSFTLLDGNTFTVNAIGPDKGTGTVAVALYDSNKCGRLLNVKVFDDLTNPITGTFTQSGYVKAFWWSSPSDMMPLCDAKGENMEATAE